MNKLEIMYCYQTETNEEKIVGDFVMETTTKNKIVAGKATAMVLAATKKAKKVKKNDLRFMFPRRRLKKNCGPTAVIFIE